MRVVHVIHSLEPGGAESVLAEFARVAPAHGIEMAVMPISRIRSRAIVGDLEAAGVPVLPLDLVHRWDPRAFARAVTWLRPWGPDVIHTHLKHADLVGSVASRVLRRPMVSTLHVVDDLPGRLGAVKRRLAGVARTATAARTVTVSDAQRSWYLEAFPHVRPETVTTLHNGVVDAARGDDAGAVRRELGIPAGAPVVLQVGLLREGKGHDVLLRAVRQLADVPDLVVLVAGDGPLRAEVEAAASDLGGRVRFLGYRTDVAPLMAASDVVVQPSDYDALPTTLIQALAAGRPVVATAVGGIPEIVTPGEGVLVPAGDATAVAGALRDLLADPGRRRALGVAARARYEAAFDADRWAGEMRRLYEDVLTAGRR
ncbi:glycosyltransferase [Actinomycetospora aeridis]|uniref:Glycosyltransferase n=1 Tax=Actinomycetospora aeridis TaxID=3129231 RepID=A0ABU8N6I1_9PSEU